MPAWLEKTVFYEVYPPSFKDSNGDGIGDLLGVIEKLDYILSIGCTGIWLNPCYASSFMDGGYDITDYYSVDPRYGTNQDLKRLFDEAHQRGMHVLLDLVPGHTSYLHPWFIQSSNPVRNRYTDWYIWTDNVWEDSAGLRSVNGMYNRDGNYIVNFFSSQPALNYGFANPDRSWQKPIDHVAANEVREELKRIIRFWLDMGADGYRVDMAFSLVKNDPRHRENIRLWQEVRLMLDTNYPEAAIVSEWSIPTEAIEAGFHMDFYLHFNVVGYNALFRSQKYNGITVVPDFDVFFGYDGKGDITLFTDEYVHFYEKTKGRGFICFQTGNHDMVRLSDRRSRRQIELAFAFILTMPGVPFIYYEDEIGMRHLHNLPSKEGGYFRTGARTPMQWDHSHNAGFSNALSDKIYLPIDPDSDSPDVRTQDSDCDSLLHTVRRLISLRKSSKAFTASGDFKVLYAQKNKYPFVYRRSIDKDIFIIAINPSEIQVDAVIDDGDSIHKIVFSNKPIDVEIKKVPTNKTGIQLAPESHVVFSIA